MTQRIGHAVSCLPRFRRRFNAVSQGLGTMDFGIADDGERTGREQAAQIAIAAFTDTAEPVLAAARALLEDEPDPGREVPS